MAVVWMWHVTVGGSSGHDGETMCVCVCVCVCVVQLVVGVVRVVVFEEGVDGTQL